MQYSHFLKLTYDIGGPPSRAPIQTLRSQSVTPYLDCPLVPSRRVVSLGNRCLRICEHNMGEG